MIGRSHALRTADERDLARVWALVRDEGIFGSPEELRDCWAAAPWTFQVSDAGDAAILSRWRDHLRLASVSAIRCTERSIASHMIALRAVARAHGFDDVLSPFTADEDVHAYVRAGMRVIHTGLPMALSRHDDIPAIGLPSGVAFALADNSFLEQLLAVDILCFSDFWRYDARLMSAYLASDRTVVAQDGGSVVGYAMCRVDRDHGIIGRLAVIPARRREGIASALLSDTLRYLGRRGVRRTVLYTQADNGPARRLYQQFGFEEAGSRKHLLAFSDVDTGEGAQRCS